MLSEGSLLLRIRTEPSFAINMMMGRSNNEEQRVLKIDQQPQIKQTARLDFYGNKFLETEMSSHFLTFLKEYEEKFTLNSKSGHGVISSGESYSKTGAKPVTTCSKDFPGPINGPVPNIKNP